MAPRPVFNQLNLVVGDMTAAADFYRRLGLTVPDDIQDAHAELDDHGGGSVTLELDGLESAQLWNASWRRPEGGGRVVLGFGLASREDVDRTYADLTGAGHPGVQPPFDAFWGGRYAIVADPDGNQIGLMSPIDPERRTWPPEPSPDPG